MPDVDALPAARQLRAPAGRAGQRRRTLPAESDAWAQFTPGHVNLFESLRDHIGGDLLGTIAAAGFGFDVFDDEALVRNGHIDGNRLLLGKQAYPRGDSSRC